MQVDSKFIHNERHTHSEVSTLLPAGETLIDQEDGGAPIRMEKAWIPYKLFQAVATDGYNRLIKIGVA